MQPDAEDCPRPSPSCAQCEHLLVLVQGEGEGTLVDKTCDDVDDRRELCGELDEEQRCSLDEPPTSIVIFRGLRRDPQCDEGGIEHTATRYSIDGILPRAWTARGDTTSCFGVPCPQKPAR